MTSEEYNERYSRQLILPGFGPVAQQKLREASVLVIGAGGLGCPALQYLAAAGVGTIGLADGDLVALSNLPRQLLYSDESVGKLKVNEARSRLRTINPAVRVITWPFHLDNSNILDILPGFDLVIDATDTFSARYMINDACVLAGKPLIHGSISGFEGQLAVFNYGAGERTNYRDLFPVPPAPGETLSCTERGVLGILPGIIGTLQAAEAIKLLSGTGDPLVNTLLTFNLTRSEWLSFSVSPRKGEFLSAPQDREQFLNWEYRAQEDCGGDYTDIGADELQKFIEDETVTIIDVREPGEQPLVSQFGHLKIPLSALKDIAPGYRDRTIVLFCHSGIRSITAAGYFPPGNRVYNLKGGIVKWLQIVNQKSKIVNR